MGIYKTLVVIIILFLGILSSFKYKMNKTTLNKSLLYTIYSDSSLIYLYFDTTSNLFDYRKQLFHDNSSFIDYSNSGNYYINGDSLLFFNSLTLLYLGPNLYTPRGMNPKSIDGSYPLKDTLLIFLYDSFPKVFYQKNNFKKKPLYKGINYIHYELEDTMTIINNNISMTIEKDKIAGNYIEIRCGFQTVMNGKKFPKFGIIENDKLKIHFFDYDSLILYKVE